MNVANSNFNAAFSPNLTTDDACKGAETHIGPDTQKDGRPDVSDDRWATWA